MEYWDIGVLGYYLETITPLLRYSTTPEKFLIECS
jgi:hypothetical protein